MQRRTSRCNRRALATNRVNASKQEGVMVLELNAPPANTYSYEMMRELDAQILDARMDAAVHVIVITGARHGKTEFFCAGAAIEMMAEGATVSVEEAKVLGIVNAVLDASAEGFRSAAVEYARKFVPPAKASRAVGLIKRAVTTGLEVGLEQGLALERELQQRLFEGKDAAEGLAAYNARRPPQFSGK